MMCSLLNLRRNQAGVLPTASRILSTRSSGQSRVATTMEEALSYLQISSGTQVYQGAEFVKSNETVNI